jgi:tRNA uridine 5-carboxymethylaminomethyl modification enzyme
MFTSRAEHRLLLRHDNADLRLTPAAFEAGLADLTRYHKVQKKIERGSALRRFIDSTSFAGHRLAHWLKRPENSAIQLPAEIRLQSSDEMWEALEIELKYAGYIARQHAAVERLRKHEESTIPALFDYREVSGLRAESRQKLMTVRPETLAQAARISGITPADIALLSIMVERSRGGGA